MKVFRYDACGASLAKPKKLRGGSVRVDSHFTRPGVFPYRDESGATIMEYRPSSEVFDEKSIESWKGVPVTNGHPSDLVTADTWRRHAIGQMGDDIRQDGPMLAGSEIVHDKPAVMDVLSGKRSALSGGYWAEIDTASGVTSGDPHVPDGIRYDRVQRQIEGNHVAILPAGHARLGHEMAMRLDSTGHGVAPAEPQYRTDSEDGMEIVFGKKTYKTDSEADMTALKRDLAEHDAAEKARTDAADLAKRERDEAKGRADAAEAKLAKLPELVAAGVTERVTLEADARKVLGAEAKLDGKSPEDIRKDVRAAMETAIKAADPTAKLDGVSEDYVRGLYAGLRVDAQRADDSLAGVRIDAVIAQGTPGPVNAGAVLRAFESQRNHDLERVSAKSGK